MKRIRVNYVVMNKNPNGIEYDRNIEYFPLEIGTYQLEKHPEISIKITKFDREQFWFIFNNRERECELPHGDYTCITLEKKPEREIEVYIESEAKAEDFPPIVEPFSLPEIKGATLKIKVDYYSRDTYSEGRDIYEETLPVIKDASVKLKWYEKTLRVKTIVSKHEVVLGIGGPKGPEFTVTDKEDGIYEDGGTYGYNDNWNSFSVKIIVKLINN